MSLLQLEARRAELDIPALPYLPMGKNVLIFRIPEEEKTAGGLFIPETVREARERGVLIAAGLAAQEIMGDHLIELGDIVWFGRFAGRESEVARAAEGKGAYVLQVKIEDVLGSVDALQRVDGYEVGCNVEGDFVYVKKPANDNNNGTSRRARSQDKGHA